METTSPRPLAVESFSDSWLSNTRPSLINVLDESTTNTNTNSFDFDTPISDNKSLLYNFVHADELFSDGLIKPSFVDPINRGVSTSSSSIITDSNILVSSSLSDSRTSVIDQDVQMGFSCCFFRRQRRLLSKKSKKVDDIDRRTLEVKSWSNCSSPSRSTVHDIESSIYEAVLHCKRSIGK